MFSGISCLFSVNYGHSVMYELRSDGRLKPAPPKIPDSSKEACLLGFATDVTAIMIYSSQIHFEPCVRFGERGF